MIRKLFYLFVFGLAGCSGTNDQSQTIDIENIQLKDLSDQPIDLKKYKGKTIFINFWATWCKPCVQEIPTIERAQEILQDEKVIFLMASNESLNQIERFKNKRNPTLTYVYLANMEELKIQALPTTYIFNPEGKLVFSETGYRNWDSPNNIKMIQEITNDRE